MCIGCGLCAKDCFPGALEVQNGTAVLVNMERCIDCGHCIAVCPQSAVTEDSVPMDDVSPVRMEINGTDLLDLMRSRRSCRHFRKEPVPESVWRQMIQAARACPTAKNLQATRYIVVTEKIPQLLDLAFLHHHNPVGQGKRLLLIMGDIDHGGAKLLLNLLQFFPQNQPRIHI